ncbi:MAG: response regulator [Paracoccaceae bacterium]|jgi:DNA-binding response OmpR family regulator|nr:response regulator [Paracoccaceae bacterium]
MGNSVLLIEDEPNIIEAISFILSRADWTVHSHSNGADAIGEVKRRMPDVVVLDVMLPGKTGFEVLQDIRGDDVTADIPVLMLTARGQTKDREMAEKSGANMFMTKPFSNSEVLEKINALVT